MKTQVTKLSILNLATFALFLFPLCFSSAFADDKPILRANINGPTNVISDLAFSANGRKLYAASWDKRVHVWAQLDGQFVYQPAESFRVPIHGGLDGAVTAIALSEDGSWLAVGGRGARLDTSGVRDEGYIWHGGALTPQQRLAEGVIYVFNTTTRQAIELRGHAGTISALKFAPASPSETPDLVSIAEVEDASQLIPEIRVWNLTTAETTHSTRRLQEFRDAGGPLATVVPQLLIKSSRTAPGELEVGICVTFDQQLGFLTWLPASDRWSQLNPAGNVLALSVTEANSGIWLMAAVNRSNGRPSLGTLSAGASSNGRTLLNFTPTTPLQTANYPYHIQNTFGRDDLTIMLTGEYGKPSPQYAFAATKPRNANPTRIPLWSGNPSTPILAVSTQGDVAAVDDTGLAIQVAKFDRNGQVASNPRKLSAQRVETTQLQFVKSGEEPGLRLQSADNSSFLFNIKQGTVSSQTAGWSSDSIASTSRVTDFNRDSATITITARNRQTPIQLAKTSDKPVTLIAAKATDSTLAVAWKEGAEPRFDLYDIASGELRRRLRGIEARVTSIDITRDHRLLGISTAAGIVHVFRLGELTESEHGLLRAKNQLLPLKQLDSKVIVAEDFPELKSGEEITAVDANGQSSPATSVIDLYELVHSLTPGTKLTLTTTSRQVTLTVGHAIEEKKPLFSILFAPSTVVPNSFDWVGWHPIGVFESGSRKAEELLGWHFNTNENDRPASFAEIGEYRDRFYRQGLLDALYRTEQIPARAATPPAQLSLELRSLDGLTIPPETTGEYLLREPHVTAILRVHEPFPDEAVGQLRGELHLGDLSLTSEPSRSGVREWSFNFNADDWTSARGQITAMLISSEYSPRVFRQSVPIRYQPPAPQITVQPLAKEADQVSQNLIVDVQDSSVQTILNVDRIDAAGQRHTVFDNTVESGRQSIPLDLSEGSNRIEVTARNASPLIGFEDLELVSSVHTIQYQKPLSTAPPIITLAELESAGTLVDLSRIAGDLRLTTPTITLIGKVQSDANLHAVQIISAGVEQNATGFQPDQLRQFEFRQDISLQPGKNEIVIAATTIADAMARTPVSIYFQPIPPNPIIDTITAVGLENTADTDLPHIESARQRLVLNQQWHQPQILIALHLENAPSSAEFSSDLEFSINGDQVAPVSIEKNGDQVVAVIPILQQNQRLLIVSRNAWGGRRESLTIPIEYQRPPTITNVEVQQNNDQPYLRTLVAQVNSPDDRPLQKYGITVSVNGTPVRDAVIEVRNPAPGKWEAKIQNISLKPGADSTLSLSVANEDGSTRQPWQQIVTTLPEQIAPPQIVLLSPETETQTDQPELAIRFRVEAQARIHTVSVTNDRYRREVVTSFDEQTGEYTAQMPLDENDNLIRLTAIDQRGQSADPVRLIISRIPRPGLIQIDSIGEYQTPKTSDQNNLTFATATTQLSGHVTISTEANHRMHIRVWLNEFLQEVIPLQRSAKDPTRWNFTAPITMNRDLNALQLELVGGPANSSSDRTLLLECQAPASQQTLHIVLLSPNQQSENTAQLINRMRESLAIDCTDDECSSPAFMAVHEYPVVGPDLQVQLLGGVFSNIRGQIDLRAGQVNQQDVAMNDVVLIFYAGQEYRFQDQSRFVLATGGRSELVQSSDETRIRQELDSLLTSDFLVEWMEQLKGAHLLFLDVESNLAQQPSRDSTDPHLGVYRVTSGTKTAIETSPLLRALSQITPRTKYLGEVSDQLAPIAATSFTPEGLKQMEFGSGAEE